MEDANTDTTSFDRVNEKLARKNKEIEILGEIFSQIRSSLDLDDILNKIGKARELFS